ncbi:MAG TPA: Asp-tRNA(Asn)/Glu-tRNA(Gln) amidotransferase subunit GatA [Chloroflexota bacterium]|nr:Asp-tRNA(Asn)/Glu-tRNA(Gln) amidotransferase subunit GatA [Chloroflexota bacterium]
MDLHYASAHELATLLTARELSAEELARATLERIEHLDRNLAAFLTVTADRALADARRADEMIARGQGGPLTGIPIALKDILSTEGLPTTCGSRILENYVPRYTGTVAARLAAVGTVLVGKTNMDEFAMGSSNENSGFGPVRNPWDLNRVPGGSSGGSAAAVAAGETTLAIGTDTGGSIRQPASFTGVVGLKPTYGRVSRYGLVAFASSLDQIGPLTRSVWDAAAVLEVIAGHDPLDSTSLDETVPAYTDLLERPVNGLRLGVPIEYFQEGMDAGVERQVRAAIDIFRGLGADIREVSLPHTPEALSTYYVISPAEAMANLARYDGVRYGIRAPADDIWSTFKETREVGLGAEVKRRILLGTYVLSAGYYDAYYLQAQKVRTLVRRDFDNAFAEVDALLAPTTPTTAFRLGERTSDPLQMYLSDVYTVPANMAGICGVSVPAGLTDGRPVGLQILGPPLAEEVILSLAHNFEQATDFSRLHPQLETEVAS